jgi:hypothetical protein
MSWWRLVRAVVVVVAVVGLFPIAARAQAIGAAATLDIKRVSGESGDSTPDGSETAVFDTESPGFNLFFSAPVTPYLAFAVEVGFEREATVTTASQANQVRLETRYTNRMRTVSALAAVHPATTRRVRLTVLGGLTFVHFERTIALSPAAPILGTPVQPTSSAFVDRMGAATVGLDCDLRVGPHVAIVPAIRAHSFRLASNLGGFSVRPSIGAKWIF